MQLAFYFDQSRCIGCFTCVVACKDWNDVPAGPASWRRVLTMEEGKYPQPVVTFLSTACYHCAEPACILACPVDAIVVNRVTGAKDVLDDRCVGCKVCTIACPFGTVNYHQATGKVIKCDLCGGDPACAKACPTAAITYVDADQTGYERMRAWAAKTAAGSAAAA